MPLSQRKLHVPSLGQLAAEGLSNVWEGTLNLPFIERNVCFLLRIRGNREGPTEGQVIAIKNLIQNCAAIKIAATVPMFNLFVKGGSVTNSKEKPEIVWSYLTPGMVEVEKQSEEWNGAIYIHVGFATRLAVDAAPYIGTLNGTFHNVGVEF
jgi:hypothetical protein